MKKLIWLFAAPILFASCKKDSDSNPTPAPTSNACTISEERDSVGNKLTSSYEFDASKRLIKEFSYTNGVKSGYTTFTYSGSTVSIQYFNMNNQADGSPAIATLNSSGYITRLISSGPDTIENTPGISKDTSNLSYNSAGQLETFNSRNWTRDASNNIIGQNSLNYQYEYSSGRASKVTNTFSSGGSSSSTVQTYIYDNSSPLVTSNPVVSFFSFAGTAIFGKLQSDRIPVKIELTSSTGEPISTSIITATVDAKGNPTKIRTAFGGFGGSYTTLYSYSCP